MSYTSLVCIITVWQLTKLVSCTGSMTTAGTASSRNDVTISAASESSTMDDSRARIMSNERHQIFNITHSNRKSRRKKTHGKGKIHRKKQLRLLEPRDTSCLRWSPRMNVTADYNCRSVTVDYCHSGRQPIPDTETCVTNTQATKCIIVHSPGCSHIFGNLTAGNYTTLVQPKCKHCFDREIYNTECITPIYTKHIYLEEIPEENSSVEKKQNHSTNTNLEVIVPAICAGAVVIVIVVVTYHMAKYTNCTKSLPCFHRNGSFNQTLRNCIGQPSSGDKTTVERSQIQPFFYQERETSFQNTETSIENETLLSHSRRSSQDQEPLENMTENEAILSNLEEMSYVPLLVNISPSIVTLNSNDLPSCQTLRPSSNDIHDISTADQECQTSSIENDRQETVRMFFDTDTGIINTPETHLAVPEIMDIPYHLIFINNHN